MSTESNQPLDHNFSIAEWLATIGLAEYAVAFVENGITSDILLTLSDSDLKECGITSLGNRKKILIAIEQLKSGAGQSVAASIPVPSPVPSPAVFAPQSSEPALAPIPASAPLFVPGIAQEEAISPSTEAVSEPEVAADPAPVYLPTAAASVTQAAPVQGKRSLLDRFGGRFLYISIIAHVVFGLIATWFVVQRISQKQKLTFQGAPKGANSSARAMEHKVQQTKVKNNQSAPPQAKRITTNAVTARVAIPSMPMPATNTVAPSRIISSPGLTGPVTMGSPAGGGGSLGGIGARSVEVRSAALARGGGKPSSDQAVINALRWLKKVQNPDGTWGKQYPGGMSGLALLCFLGHGETPASKEFGGTVANAINAMLTNGTKNKGNLHPKGGIEPYQHGMATYALCEAYTMTKDERLAPVITQAVAYILKGERPDGGWAYNYSLAPDTDGKINSDTSVSGWQIQALKAAKLTGLPIDGIHEALDNSMKNLDRVFNPKNGSYGYRKAGDHTYTLTGVGVLSKVVYEGRIDFKARAGIKDILAGPPVNYDAPTANLYAWYYNTQACFQVGGSAWQKWNRMFQDELVAHQSPEGFWIPTKGLTPDGKPREPGGLAVADTIDGQLYRTCLCALMLEVYYRYLPSGKNDNAEPEHSSLLGDPPWKK